MSLSDLSVSKTFFFRKYEVSLKTWPNNRIDFSKKEETANTGEQSPLFPVNSWSAASFYSSIMPQSRKRGPNTWLTLSWIPLRLPHGLMLMFSYFQTKVILCNCMKQTVVPFMLEGTGFSIKVFSFTSLSVTKVMTSGVCVCRWRRGVKPIHFLKNLLVFWQNASVKFPDAMLSVNLEYFIIKITKCRILSKSGPAGIKVLLAMRAFKEVL